MKWTFWIDRGGTFTDVVARDPAGNLLTHKELSESPGEDSVILGIRHFIGDQNPRDCISQVRLGTTLATNMLLERDGSPCALFTTMGFADVLWIGDQRRRSLFELGENREPPLYSEVVEVIERISGDGNVHIQLNEKDLILQLQKVLELGIESVAISFVNSYLNAQHELRATELAWEAGFRHVIAGCDLTGQIGYVERTRTALVEAYTGPRFRTYLKRLKSDLEGVPILFMQSHGGLVPLDEAMATRGLLSGPAGGVVGAARSVSGENRVVAFDMGGTSTDISFIVPKPEVQEKTEINGVSLSIPSVDIVTIAAGGGSIVSIKDGKMHVGPESAGANPGPMSYGLGGPLTVTDINLFLGRIHIDQFPKVFGPERNSPLDLESVQRALAELSRIHGISVQELAHGFLDVAIESIAQAIAKQALSQGYQIQDFSLNAFGGAAGQVACDVAERLGVDTVFISHHAGVLSALGIGLSDVKKRAGRTVNRALSQAEQLPFPQVDSEDKPYSIEQIVGLTQSGGEEVFYFTSDLTKDSLARLAHGFSEKFRQRFGFENSSEIRVRELISVATFEKGAPWEPPAIESETFKGPCTIGTQNIFVANGWSAERRDGITVLLRQCGERGAKREQSEAIELELFNQRFQSIAQQMGTALQRSARSLNIRERLDFSCAIFDCHANLIANAPHIPVHLGSMEDSVRPLLDRDGVRPGESYLVNSPYSGGTHLPDITVITPYFIDEEIRFFVASRGHHVDVGGTTPGSMPALSRHIADEGIEFEMTRVVSKGEFESERLGALLREGDWPARDIETVIADVKAQLAANQMGVRQLQHLVEEFGYARVYKYAQRIESFSAQKVRESLLELSPGGAKVEMDSGDVIGLNIRREKDIWVFDFSETSDQVDSNFNAPEAVTRAAVLYSLRCLLGRSELPLNSGCLKPVKIVLRPGSLLSPRRPAAVVAGNVETSQLIVDAVFSALGVSANSQGTMNNMSFGCQGQQYYETLGGGSGAGPNFAGLSGRQIHMTNSKMTDVEVLEERFPLRVESFAIRYSSGGEGDYRGGDGLIRRIWFSEEFELSILSHRRRCPAQGLRAGGHGWLGRSYVDTLERRQALQSCYSGRMEGERLVSIETPGGGGYGKPLEFQHKYFAFGSNICRAQIQSRMGNAVVLGVGCLQGHRLCFRGSSKRWGGSVADIVASDEHAVWGVVYGFTGEQIHMMDGYESGYDRISVVVQMGGEETSVVSYQMQDSELPEGLPSLLYIRQIYLSAISRNFPLSYLRELEKVLKASTDMIIR